MNLTARLAVAPRGDSVERSELEERRAALNDAGAETHISSPESDRVKGWKKGKFGGSFPVDVKLKSA